jgi:hypothetical protein
VYPLQDEDGNRKVCQNSGRASIYNVIKPQMVKLYNPSISPKRKGGRGHKFALYITKYAILSTESGH